ncbi:hypothetical protein SDC9_170378 [bioreactor metagenome]|uniref:Uncharacterized protein n=1 Tax=bioreactor metagenome TaxID=1076179 RepID=A0A645GGX5_9ZZZZ
MTGGQMAPTTLPGLSGSTFKKIVNNRSYVKVVVVFFYMYQGFICIYHLLER